MLFLLSLSAMLQANADIDSTQKIIHLPDIEVTSQAINNNSAVAFLPNLTINNQIIKTLQPMQLSEIVVFSPGISLTNLGGMESMKTISIRGTGSTRSLILLDGMPLNSSQNSSFDLNLIAPSLINKIEIIRGGASAIFGGNAIGGAVNIITHNALNSTQSEPTTLESLKISGQYGSFQEIAANILGCRTIAKTTLSANINYLSSEGNYPFLYNQFGKEEKFYRENADYKNLTLSASAKTNINN